MKVSPISNSLYSFGSAHKQQIKDSADKNPISKAGEKAKLVKLTFFGGLALGGRLLLELCDGDFIIDNLNEGAEKFVNKYHKEASSNKKVLMHLGVLSGFVIMAISGFALLYTLFKAPSINYNGNVNAFKKGKDMDVYIKGNKIEKELYTQMNEKAKDATPEEKDKLKTQYMQMQMAKNRIPEFVKNL